MTDAKPLDLYDIASPLGPRSYAPNPSKARLALSFKCAPFQTTWVDILDISNVREGLGSPATRKFDDGSDFYTLPMLQDLTSGKVVGDSFDIADYLEDKFPDSGGCLSPPASTRTGLDYESPSKDTPFFAPLTTQPGLQQRDLCKIQLARRCYLLCTYGALCPVPSLEPKHGRRSEGPYDEACTPKLLG